MMNLTTFVYDTFDIPLVKETGYDVNSTADDESGDDFTPNLFKWNGGEMLFLVVLFVTGVVGNVMVIYTYHFKWRRSNFTLFIEVLAAIDLTNCLLAVTLFFVMTVYKGALFEIFCGTASYVAFATALSSSIVLVIVAFERKQKIRNPLKQAVTTGITKKLCCGAVVIGMTVSVPGIFLFGKKETVFVDDGIAFNLTWCFFKEDAFRTCSMYIWAVVLGFVFLFVIASLSSLYCSIWRELNVYFKGRGSLAHFEGHIDRQQNKNSNYYRAHKTTTRLFFIITMAFFVTYFPYFIALGILIFGDNSSQFVTPVGKAFIDLAKLSPLMSNVINPIIYSLSSARFRKEVVNIFKGLGIPDRNKVFFGHVARTFVRHSQSVTSPGDRVKLESGEQIITELVNEKTAMKLPLS
ncbi:C5a anaphylatoxin chemotactic receptor 1-like isoform X2 [Gigantopelta aegis]|uniref:C5a anaphylatoxin chemotactic receptor 1-like isoform X2 n=1 Tax=Gigantopelta aegis TaxID=1735272 RepID=UPI001B88D355|nr:C5a anaphylatoxin chemotactic receptor 1-like isoform X2 [Gigantopelta aegis]XP_041375466.1 C5a anaphylatoxin chemotactic receptor 1-like isoform X2 [Gigantopelta aegis]